MQKPNFGFLHLKKPKTSICCSKSVFDAGDDEDNNDDTSHVPVNSKESKVIRSKISKADQRYIEDALKEDPSIFAYDEVYDSLKESVKSEEKQKDNNRNNEKNKKSRYIAGLLKAAEEREIEYERRFERKLQKEREQEEGLYPDKESFITNSYREKLEKFEELNKKRMEEEQIEAILDVKKQGNLNSFYKFMLKNACGELKTREQINEKPNDTKPKCSEGELLANARSALDSVHKRHYRQRERSESSPEGDSESESKETVTANGNTDSKEVKPLATDDTQKEADDERKSADSLKTKTKEKSTSKTVSEIQAKIASKRREMLEFVKKKTVGQLFVDAQKRYFERAQFRKLNKDYLEKTTSQ